MIHLFAQAYSYTTDLYVDVAKHVHESEALAFAMASKGCRSAMQKASLPVLVPNGSVWFQK